MKNIFCIITILLGSVFSYGQSLITAADISSMNAGEGDLYKDSSGTIYIGLTNGVYHPLSNIPNTNIYTNDGQITNNRYVRGVTTNYLWFDKFSEIYFTTSNYFRITSQNSIEIDAANTTRIKGTNGILLLNDTKVTGNIAVTGSYIDSNNTPGTTGQLLSSTNSGTEWISPSAMISSDANNNLQAGTDNGIYYNNPLKSYGKINADGTAAKIKNATVSKIPSSLGQYQITFTTAMSDANYIIQLTQPSRNGAGNDDPGIAYYDQQTTGFKVRIGDNDNGGTDRSKFDSGFMYSIFD